MAPVKTSVTLSVSWGADTCPRLSAVVAEARFAAAGLSAGSSSVAPPPGAAAARLPAPPGGREQQLLTVQQLRSLLQHHAPL